MVRDYTKLDDSPISLTQFAESAVRAYKIAMTPPMAPVVLVADAVLQEEPMSQEDRHRLRVPKLSMTSPPAGDSGAVAEVARMLVAAENPLIVTGRLARTPNGLALLVELAEVLQAPVSDRRMRMNFPTRHPLYAAGNVATADVILALEVPDLYSVTHRLTPINRMGMESQLPDQGRRQVVTISSLDLLDKKQLSGHGALQRSRPGDRRRRGGHAAGADRRVQASHHTGSQESLRRAPNELRRRTPGAVTTRPRVKRHGAGTRAPSPRRGCLRNFGTRSRVKTGRSFRPTYSKARGRRGCGTSGSIISSSADTARTGIGYGAPAAVGAALANKKHGRLTVNIQSDGDLNYAPGVLWTAAHHRIPLLTVMHNNRSYHQERMYVADMAARAERDVSRVGHRQRHHEPQHRLRDDGQGLRHVGHRTHRESSDLGPALKKAVEAVKRGEPALVDVVSQPR